MSGIILFVGMAFCSKGVAQQINYTRLQALYEQLPAALLQGGAKEVRGFPLYLEMRGDTLADLGIGVLTTDNDALLPRFINRKLLEVAVATTRGEAVFALERDKCRLYLNAADYATGTLWDMEQGFDVLKRATGYAMRYDSLQCFVQWTDGADKLTLVIPANVQVLTQKDKMELEQELEGLMKQSYPEVQRLKADDSNKFAIEGDIFALNRGYLFIPEMSNAIYYHRDRRGRYKLIYSKEHLHEIGRAHV